AGAEGLVVFLVANLSNDSGKVVIGSGPAGACNRSTDDCLPDVKYIDTTGKAWTAETLAGKVVVVNFWATWCHPCQKEIPDLSRAYDRYKSKGVVILGVMADQPPPSDADLLNFQSDNMMTYPVVRATSDILLSFHYPQSLPTTFIYNRAGKQVFSHLGAMSERSLDALLDQYVVEK